LNVNCTNLRSRTSFLLINNTENLMLLWHGCGTTDEQKLLANKSALKLRERFDLIEIKRINFLDHFFVQMFRRISF
jgi:hypothetical protein